MTTDQALYRSLMVLRSPYTGCHTVSCSAVVISPNANWSRQTTLALIPNKDGFMASL